MTGICRFSLGIVAVSLIVVQPSFAFHGRSGSGRGPATSSSYTAPTFWILPYYNCPPAATVIPVPDAKPRSIFANPVPAPPSPTGEPPLRRPEMPPAKTSSDPRMPVIVTSHALGGGYVPGAAPLPQERCRVGFWNLSGRDVTLMVEGKMWTLARNRALTIDLERQFGWQIDQQPQHVERVPEGHASHEVVIRD